jgi:secreted trypsin-like serine protease
MIRCLLIAAVLCGVQSYTSPLHPSPRIILGQLIDTFDVPFYCTLFVEFPSDAGTFMCGCVIISPGIVLSAAHCFQSEHERFAYASVRLYGQFRNKNRRLVVVDAQKVTIHPSYGPSKAYGDDLAVFQLPETAKEDSLPPLRLSTNPTEWGNLRSVDELFVVGVGRTEWQQTSFSAALSMGYPLVTSLSRRDCSHPMGFGDLNAWDPSVVATDLCAGPFDRCVQDRCEDSCSGDSGGPLYRPGTPPVLFGIVSRGTESCGIREGYPGIYSMNQISMMIQNIFSQNFTLATTNNMTATYVLSQNTEMSLATTTKRILFLLCGALLLSI